ncbi:MAG: ankyrin repeat domain-containing protein [Gammaproteobacteria bacterium]
MHRMLWALLFILIAGGAVAGSSSKWSQAITGEDVTTIGRLLDQVEDVNFPNHRGKTALMVAARKGHPDVVRLLLEAGAKVNTVNSAGGNALMYAAVSGDAASLRLLLEHDAAVNATGANGWSATMIAAAKGYGSLLDLLIMHGADTNVRDIYGWTPLMRATHEGRHGIVKSLLSKTSPEIDAQDESGLTALHRAAAKGYVDIARLLIEHGADVSSTDLRGRTPLMVASSAGNKRIADLLSKSVN